MVLVLGAVVLGALIGSFANVLIYRIPRGESVVFPASHCPECGRPIRARHNVPLFGWLWLRGRCADCKAPIGYRYPLVEALVAAAFGLIVWHWGVSWTSLLLLVFAVYSVVLAAIDIDVQRLPNVLVGSLAAAAGTLIVIACAISGDWGTLARSAIGAVSTGLLYAIAFVIYPKGLGFGDVKLAPVLGAVTAYFGWASLAVGVFTGFLWGALAGIVIMVSTKRTRHVRIPFGPWMLLGAWTGIIFGAPIGDWYMHSILGL